MIADFSKLFKKKSKEASISPRPNNPLSLITNMNPEDEQQREISSPHSKKKNNKKTGCLGCILSSRNSALSGKSAIKKYLLNEQTQDHKNKKTLVLDLDETLVHSSFQPFIGMDESFEIDFSGKAVTVYVSVRPGAIEFIEKMGEIFEIVVFTASQPLYAIPVIKSIDKNKNVTAALCRDDCDHIDGMYIKNLSKLGRDLKDNSPRAISLQPENAYICSNYYFNKTDTELYDLMPFLEYLSKINDVRSVPNKRMEYELTHGAHKIREVSKPDNIPDFEEIDIEEYSKIAPPKAVNVRNTLKNKKSISTSTSSSNSMTQGIVSLKTSFPSTFGKDSRTVTEDSILDLSWQHKKSYKTSGFQDVNESSDDKDYRSEVDDSFGKQKHRSIMIKYKDKARSKVSISI